MQAGALGLIGGSQPTKQTSTVPSQVRDPFLTASVGPAGFSDMFVDLNRYYGNHEKSNSFEKTIRNNIGSKAVRQESRAGGNDNKLAHVFHDWEKPSTNKNKEIEKTTNKTSLLDANTNRAKRQRSGHVLNKIKQPGVSRLSTSSSPKSLYAWYKTLKNSKRFFFSSK